MASKSYNGWSGITRYSRYKQFTYLRHNGFFIKQDHCQMCGDPVGVGFGYHAEEYGETVSDYLRHCYFLCAGCHGLLHVRFRFPNRWNRYRDKIKQGVPRVRVTNMGQVYGKARNMIDIPHYPKVELGNWSDELTCKGHKGAEKIPKKLTSNGDLRREDWNGIDFLDLGIGFDFNDMGTGNENKE